MKDKILSFGLAIALVLFAIYINTDSNKGNSNYSQYTKLSKDDILSDKNLLKSFSSGISIKDIGDLVIIEQKPNATVIIDKSDLDEIIAFLNSSNISE